MRLSCPARDVDHKMTSDANTWRDVTQSLRQILCFTYIFARQMRENSELEYVINRLSYRVLIIALSINPRPLSGRELKFSG